jgi:hypothetical protein
MTDRFPIPTASGSRFVDRALDEDFGARASPMIRRIVCLLWCSRHERGARGWDASGQGRLAVCQGCGCARFAPAPQEEIERRAAWLARDQ